MKRKNTNKRRENEGRTYGSLIVAASHNKDKLGIIVSLLTVLKVRDLTDRFVLVVQKPSSHDLELNFHHHVF